MIEQCLTFKQVDLRPQYPTLNFQEYKTLTEILIHSVDSPLYNVQFAAYTDLYIESCLVLPILILRINKLGQDFMGPLQVWPMVCGCRGSKNVTYRQQTTDKKVNTEPL